MLFISHVTAILALSYFLVFFKGDLVVTCLLPTEMVAWCRNRFRSIQAFKKHVPFFLVHPHNLYVEAQELYKSMWLMKIFPDEWEILKKGQHPEDNKELWK